MKQDYTISDELRALGSPLEAFSRKMPFDVPADYFAGFEAAMHTRVTEASLPQAKNQEAAFAVPEGYFDQLPREVLAKIDGRKENKSKTIVITRNWWLPVRAAAAIFLLLLGGWVYRSALVNRSFDSRLASVPDASLSAYVIQTSSDLNTEKILAGDPVKLQVPLTEEEITQYLDDTGWQ